jgi:CBS domain-containing protein
MTDTISFQESGTRAVDSIMTTRLVTIDERANIARALSILAQHRIRHLVVLDERGQVVGLFSERDLLKHIAMNAGGQGQQAVRCLVKDLMIKRPFTVQPNTPIQEAAKMMAKLKIGCLPVVGKDEQRLGIITTSDVLKFFGNQG